MNSNLERLQETFSKMSTNEWDVSGQLKWGFYFADDNVDTLHKVCNELKENDFKLDEVKGIEDNKYKLCVSKIEALTAEKLHRRNIAFNELANYCSGMG